MSIAIYQEMILASKRDDEISIMSIFKTIHALMPEIDFSFSNVYRELPIINTAQLHAIHEDCVEFKASSLQMAVIHHCCETIIQSPLLSASVIGRVTCLDTSNNIVSLGNFSYADITSNKRMSVRVQLNKPLNVLLSVDGQTISAMLLDISFGGCRIVSPANVVFEKAQSLSLHLKLFHDNSVMKTEIPFSFLRSDRTTSSQSYATMFHHTAETDKFLSLFIFKHQHEIVCELKGRELPQGRRQYKNAPPAAEPLTTASNQTGPKDAESPAILIIDDQPLNVALLDAIISQTGHRTLKAYSGHEGRQLALQEQPSLILLDITMPVEDGVTTCRKLKADPRTADIPVIFISAHSSADDKASGFANGAVDYITKPFESAEVLARVFVHLRMRERYVAAVQQQHQILDKLQSAQQGMLIKPADMPEAAFAVCYRAVHSVGGDYYDVSPMNGGNFAYFVADVSGHDLDTSFNTPAIKALFQQGALAGASSEEIMRAINHGVMPLFFCNGMHMTACLVQLDRRSGSVTLVNAGHLPVIHLDRDGEVTLIEAEGDILGVFDELVLRPTTKEVRRGDRLFLFTDGLVEQDGENMDRHGGIAQLSAFVRETAALPLNDAVQAICSRVFAAGTPPGDDIILLGVEV